MKPTRENVRPHSGSSFTCLDIDLPSFDNNYHYHPEIELTWVTESSGQRIIGDSVESFTPGDLILIGSQVPHQYRNWSQGRACSRVIQFRSDLFGADFFNSVEFQKMDALLNESNRGLSFSPTTTKAVQSQIEQLFELPAGPEQALRLIEILHTLSIDAKRKPLASPSYSASVTTRKIDRLQRVLNYLESHWREPITLQQVSDTAALHPQSVSRFFQQHLGMSYQSYLVQLRLSHAARELIETEHTITTIAFDCGFNNLGNFNRLFKANYGKTPSAFRRV